jgi:hypothetical protein
MMSDIDNKDRSPMNLSFPETTKIAALLAELMPSGTPATTAPTAALAASEPQAGVPVADVPPSPDLTEEPELNVRTNFVPPPPAARRATPERRITATVTRIPIAKAALVPSSVSEEEISVVLSATAATPNPAPVEPAAEQNPPHSQGQKNLGDGPTGAFLGRYNWKNEAAVGKPGAKIDDPTSHGSASDIDWIPLGELTATAYFSLVNWRNEPDRPSRIRRRDLGLDEDSLTQAKTVPFFVVGKPRVPDRTTVAAILSQVAWE